MFYYENLAYRLKILDNRVSGDMLGVHGVFQDVALYRSIIEP